LGVLINIKDMKLFKRIKEAAFSSKKGKGDTKVKVGLGLMGFGASVEAITSAPELEALLPENLLFWIILIDRITILVGLFLTVKGVEENE
jgi:hypothetical protein